MRLVSFGWNGDQRVGADLGDRIVDVQAACIAQAESEGKGAHVAAAAVPSDMRQLIQRAPEVLEDVRRAVASVVTDRTASGRRVVYQRSEVNLKAPIADPPKIICIGLNYKDHAEESGMALPKKPVLFTKFASSIVGPGEAVVHPGAAVTSQVDYEVELAVVIGRGGKEIAESSAMDHVFGYTVANDVSARDLQFEDGQWVKGKALDTFVPLGPAIVTADEVSDPHALGLRLLLNGEVMQDSTTQQLIFNIPQVIAYLSTLFTLEPGDVILTGTPPGVGFARKPPVFLKPGDHMVAEVDGVGRLENPVVGK